MYGVVCINIGGDVLDDLERSAVVNLTFKHFQPPDDLRERARWRLLSSKGLKGVVSKVQLKKVKDLTRGYMATPGGGGGGDGDGDISNDDLGSDEGEVSSVVGGDRGIGGGGDSGDDDSGGGDSGGGDSDVDIGDDDSGDVSGDDVSGDGEALLSTSHGDVDLGSSSTDGGSVSGDAPLGGRVSLHSGGPSNEDIRAAKDTLYAGREPACKRKTGVRNAVKSIGSGTNKNQHKLSSGRRKAIAKDGPFSGKRQRAESLFVGTLCERQTQKQVCVGVVVCGSVSNLCFYAD